MSTALTPGGPDEWAERDAQRRAVDGLVARVRVFACEILLDGYREGACDFESLMRDARRAARMLPPFEQRQLMGALALAALDEAAAPRSGRGRPAVPQQLRDLAAELIQIVREREGLPTKTNIKGTLTCYERVAELLAEFGIAKSAKTIEGWAAPRS